MGGGGLGTVRARGGLTRIRPRYGLSTVRARGGLAGIRRRLGVRTWHTGRPARGTAVRSARER
ncbi:hypothetical protein ABZZ16_27085, partial [Streptomyces sp. NPDC006386]|uniref:hypothetical protein n=1 Tax=Streptomyces sp. NPDC006386 TaxID=3156762 RepID=UPI0033B299B4